MRSLAAPSTLQVASVFLAALAVLSFGIQSYDLWPADEPRYAEVAREMLESGDYLVPRVNGEIYLEKPPLLFWSIAMFSRLTGQVDALSARLPSLLSALGVLLITYRLARRMYGPGVALWTVLILMSTVRFWWQARNAQIDMLLTLFMVIALYALWRWEEERHWRWWAVLALAMAAGTLAKGPPALLFPILFILTFYWYRPLPRKQLHWVALVLVAVAVTALWYVPARLAGAESAETAVQSGVFENLFRNTVGRMFLGVSKAQMPWYYLTTLPLDCLPWTLFFPWFLAWLWRARKTNQAGAFLWFWMAPAFIFFSLSIGKRALYLLPLFPAFAIGMAAALDELVLRWKRRPTPMHRILLILGAGLVLIGFLPVAGLLTPYAGMLPWYTLCFSGVLWATGTVLAAMRRRVPSSQWIHVITAVMAIVYCAAIAWILPAIDQFKSAKDFCAPVRALAENEHAFRLYSVGFSREEYIFYAHRFHEPVFTGLVGATPTDMDALIAKATLQKRARKVIAEAVEEVPLESLTRITPQDRDTLRQAIESAIRKDKQAEAMVAFEPALIAELDRFFTGFADEAPAFMFIQEEDWRWMAALCTEPPQCHIVREQQVGSREVLLFANESGAALARQTAF